MRILKSILWFFHYLSWIYRYGKLQLGFNTLNDIKILSIEFSSVCNLRCKYCYLDKLDRPKILDINVYEKLIKEVSENPQFHIKVMEWPISGEFFIYPYFKEVIEITKRYMDKNPNFRPHIILNENLILMDDERMDLILESGVVKQLICSVDGHDAQTFEEMRPPAKFDVVLARMRVLKRKNEELGHPVHIQVNNGRDECSFGKHLSREMREILMMGDSVTTWYPKNWNESFNKSQKSYSPAKGFCTFVFNNVTLSSSGYISKCCMDLRGQTEYADLRQSSLKEIWHSNIRKGFLKFMFQNKRRFINGCQSCSITAVNNNNKFSSLRRRIKQKILFAFKGKKYFLEPVGLNHN